RFASLRPTSRSPTAATTASAARTAPTATCSRRSCCAAKQAPGRSPRSATCSRPSNNERREPMRAPLILVVLLATLSACGQKEPAKTSVAAAPKSCEQLAALALPDTTIASVEAVAAGAFKSPAPAFGPGADFSKLPAFSRVTGSIKPSADSDIRFEVWLPASGWNGKFMQTGNGGAAGSIVYGSLAEPLARGYAVANTDTGHQGGGGDFAWAGGHPEKLTDYQYRAVHQPPVVGKAVESGRYGKSPERSYWNGCSTGGRQGLKEAQKYPGDYDAIVAGAPASNWSPLMALSISIQRNMTGPDGLSPGKLGVLTGAALAACDARDG